MILLTSNKREFPITVIKNLHDALNDYYINEVYAYQNDSLDYQNIVSRFSNNLEELYDLIKEMKRYNNNSSNNNNKVK